MDRRLRLLARLFALCGVLLVPWIWVLIEQLHGQAGKRSFDSSWVGLDVLEAVCLLAVARLLSRRHFGSAITGSPWFQVGAFGVTALLLLLLPSRRVRSLP